MIAVALTVVDLLAAGAVSSVVAIHVVTVRAWHRYRRPLTSSPKKLLVLDMSYTLDAIRTRQLHEPVLARDLNGFFEHVWSIHPCATAMISPTALDAVGPLKVERFAARHTIVESRMGRYHRLNRLPMLNFVLAQYELLRYLTDLIDREQISVIRAGDPYYLGLFGLALSRATGVPSVFRIPLNYDTFYTRMGHLAYPRLFRRRWIEQLISRFTLKRADLVAGSNADSLDFALANGARPERSTIFRVGNLIHAAHFEAPERRPDAASLLNELRLTGKPFSITVCRLEPLKHIDDVLRALAEVRASGIDLYGLIVGDGRLRKELEGLAESLGIAAKVVFAGNRPQEWIAAALPHAAVVLSPHMGRGLTEALLSETPSVAYDVEWQAEVVRPGETGELVPYRDWHGMARAVQRLHADPERARRLGKAARAFVLDMMDPKRLNQHERDEYLKLFARTASSAH